MLDSAVAGYISISVAGSANVVLTYVQGAADQERNWHFNLTGVLTGNINVLFPQNVMKQFSVANATTGAFSLSIGNNNGASAPAGTVVAVPQGYSMALGSTGTNVYVRNNSASIFNATGAAVFGSTLAVTGHVTLEGVTSTGATGTNKLVFDTAPTISAPVITGHSTIEGVTPTGATGTGNLVFGTGPTFSAPLLGTPASGVLTNCTGLPLGSVTGLAAGIGTFLGTPSSANLATALTDELGTGNAIFGTEGTFVPTDQSGASLAFTINRAVYSKIGNRVFVELTLTFPGTADVSASVIGLGALPNGANVTGVAGMWTIYFAGATFLMGIMTPNTNNFSIYDSTGTAQHNNTLSATTIRMQFNYSTV